MQLSATVTAIDNEDRVVTVKGPEGNVVTLAVGEQVRNFDQVEAGDNIDIEYFESTAIYVTPPGEATSMNAETEIELAPLGDKPGMTQVGTAELTAIVEAIDVDNRMVTLKGPEGEIHTREVQDDTVDLTQIEVGDQVVAQVTQAMAISVKQP